MKKQFHGNFTEESMKWLAEQSKKQGHSKNAILQALVNEAMKKDLPPTGTE